MSKLFSGRGTDINIRSGPQMREYDAIVSRLASDHPESLLDWGCGWGQVSHLLKQAGLDVTSFDYREDVPSDGMYRLERFPDIEAHISSSDPVALPFDTGTFDAVLSCGVLEHVAEPEASLEEIRRILRPGGTFYVYKLPNRWSYLEKIAKWIGLYYHGKDRYDRVYTRSSAAELLERHGFEVEEIRRANILPLTISNRAARRFSQAIWRVNRLLAKLPLVNLFATNVELVATSGERRPAPPQRLP